MADVTQQHSQLTTFFIAPLAFSLHSTNMIRPLALALFLSTALIHADHLRGNVAIMDETEQPRDLAAVDPCTLMTEQQWVNLVAFSTPKEDAIQKYRECVAAQLPDGAAQNTTRTARITGNCYGNVAVMGWKGAGLGEFECTSNQECANAGLSDRCFYMYNASSCTRSDTRMAPECNTIPVPIGDDIAP